VIWRLKYSRWWIDKWTDAYDSSISYPKISKTVFIVTETQSNSASVLSSISRSLVGFVVLTSRHENIKIFLITLCWILVLTVESRELVFWLCDRRTKNLVLGNVSCTYIQFLWNASTARKNEEFIVVLVHI
jgi:hypothetical protein